MKKAFTVIELIAVIVVLAIILAIAVPGITGIIRSSTMKAVESDAKLVLDSIRLKKIEDDTFDPTILTEANIESELLLTRENYSALEVKINEGQTYIKITGQGKWSGFSACGTYFNMQVNEGDCYLDFNDPVITLLGDSFVSINVGQAYNDAGATANDVEDGDITSRIVKTGTVNPSVPGTYNITYNVSDTAGREAVSVTRTVYVIDVEAPVITILGDNPVNINVVGTYSDAGATALDDADGDVTSKIITTGTVNPSVAGTYSITYTVSDNAGHESTAVRTVNVIDNVLPTVIFSMNGNTAWAKTRSTTVTVNDTHTGVNTSSLKYQWTTSTTAPTEASFATTFTNGGTLNSPAGVTGAYYLWILAKDNAGNTSIVRTNVFNLDNTVPVITMNGGSPVSVLQGNTYTDAGAVAADSHSGVGSVTSTGSVNVNAPGTYTINYNVSDNAGNAAVQVTRTVNVVNSTWLITSNQTWTVPVTGKYNIEMHGGGGGGAGSYCYYAYGRNTFSAGHGGGGSGDIFNNVSLTAGTQYPITIGTGGAGFAGQTFLCDIVESICHDQVINYLNITASSGGATSFGALYTTPGGKGANGFTPTNNSGGISSAGGAAQNSVQLNINSGTISGGAGGQGNINNTAQTYGDGGLGAYVTSNGAPNSTTHGTGATGQPGAVIITYVGP